MLPLRTPERPHYSVKELEYVLGRIYPHGGKYANMPGHKPRVEVRPSVVEWAKARVDKVQTKTGLMQEIEEAKQVAAERMKKKEEKDKRAAELEEKRTTMVMIEAGTGV
jgi:hypothetical protein